MKYSRLTKEQFEELHKEFINFLATQSITADEWATMKAKKPVLAEQELDVFSDLIWEGVLSNARYFENISEQQMNLFYAKESSMSLLVVKILKNNINIMTVEGFTWLKQNLTSDYVEIFTASKDYLNEPNSDKFKLIKEGAYISEGDLFRAVKSIV